MILILSYVTSAIIAFIFCLLYEKKFGIPNYYFGRLGIKPIS